MSDELAKLDATAQAALVASDQISPAELVDAAIGRIERANPELNAVIHPLFDKARQAARGELPAGPFRGVPMLIKDLGPLTAGDPMCAGMGLLKRRGFVAPLDSFITRKLRRAGFVLCGKTNAPELGILPTTEPVAFGPTRNPYDRGRSPGGSSGGSAAAVAAGMVPVAHANDGGGSIRIPASCCGLVGLKPTRGRVSQGPALGDVNGGLTVDHVVARSVRDSAALLDVLAGAMPGDPYAAPPPARPFAAEVGADPGALRIGFTTTYLSIQGQATVAHADCVAAVERAAALLGELGHRVEEVRIEPLLVPEYVPRFISVWSAGVASALDGWAELLGAAVTPDEVEPLTWALGQMGQAVSSSTYLRAWGWLQLNARQVARFWKDHDLFLTPTVAEPPPPLGTFDAPAGDAMAPLFRAAGFAPFTPPFNVTGQPAISLPLHRSGDGLPIGVQLVGAYAREDLLLRVAAQLEAARPFEHAATM
ncbi:MAG TPA: amidase family protein [Kofleriaceae bacterium]|nr:amidase family protein [Kofleriaceae bacterium]